MVRRNRRRTRAHLLRELKRVLSHPGIRTFRHSLADRMIAQARRGNGGVLRQEAGPAGTLVVHEF